MSIDDVVYDGTWPSAAGAALSLDPTQFASDLNDDPLAWCDAQDPFGDGDLGTPGSDNPSCP